MPCTSITNTHVLVISSKTVSSLNPSTTWPILQHSCATSIKIPLKAGIVQSVSEYPWSSWGEYTGSVPPALSLCATNVVLKRMPLSDLQELVDAPLSDDVMILDIDDNPRVTIGDQEVRQYLLDHFQISKPLNIQAFEKEQRNQILLSLLDLGAGFRQISRITGVPYGVIHRLSSKR